MSIKTITSVRNLPQELGKAYSAILAYLTEKGERPKGPAFTAYFNMDMEKLEVEIGFPVTKEIAGKGDILADSISCRQESDLHV